MGRRVDFTEEMVNRSKTVDEPAWIPVEVTKFETKLDKNKADLYVYTCKPLDDKYKGMLFFCQFSEKALGFLIPFAKAVGAPVGPKGLSGFDLEFPVSKKLRIYVKAEEYMGKLGNQVKDYRPFAQVEAAKTEEVKK